MPYVHVAGYKLLHGAFIKKQHLYPQQESNGDDIWQSPVSFSSSLVSCFFRTGLWDFSPNSLLRRLKTVLEFIAVPFKHKIAWISLQELFGEQPSLRVVFCGQPHLFLSQKVSSALNLKIALCTAVLEQCNLAPLSLSVYPSPSK